MIGVFLGEQNSGKTLSMSYYAYQYYKEGFNIYSNYNLNFPHETITKDLLEQYTTEKRQLDRSVFLLDEGYLFLDSRTFGKKQQRIFTYFILQTSKRNCHVYMTAQFFNTIEKRFRENSSFQCYCNRVIKEESEDGFYYRDVTSNLRFMDDTSNLYIKQAFVIKRLYQGMIPNDEVKIYYLKAEPVFKMFDTKQLLDIT